MTARHQIRVGGRRLGRERGAPIDATPAPPLGEILQLARERKGVDLHRAERDTKIRAKHLEALENGAYSELPGAVYTKGFLRNYALYLGLDPDDVLSRWRSETSTTRRTEAVAVTPPRPMAEPGRSLTFSRSIIVAALVSVAILAFVAYVVFQVARFNQVLTLSVDGPQVVELSLDAEAYVLSGTTVSGATVSVSGAADFLRTTEAATDGRWSLEVPVLRGRNDFTITASTADTLQPSPPVNVIITVPVPATDAPPSVSPSSSAATAPLTQLTLTAPLDGVSSDDGQVTVSGTTTGSSVTVVVEGIEATSSPPPSGSPAASPARGGSAAPSQTVDVTPATDGSFTQALSLTEGSWRIIVRATGTGLTSAETGRTVTVVLAGLTLVIEARGGDAWIQVRLDDRPAEGWNGHVLRSGETQTFTADETIFVRTGNSGATFFTRNGEELGALGPVGAVENWIFDTSEPPRRSL